MSYTNNLLANPAFVSSLKQDDSSATASFVFEGSTYVEPVVVVGYGSASATYPVLSTITVDKMPRTAEIADIFVFSGGSTLTLTLAITVETTANTVLTGTISGVQSQDFPLFENQANEAWSGIAVGEKIVEHKTHSAMFQAWPNDSVVTFPNQIDLNAFTNFNPVTMRQTNNFAWVLQYAWCYSPDLNLGSPLVGSRPKHVLELKMTDRYSPNDNYASRNGASQIKYHNSDIRNVMGTIPNRTTLQLANLVIPGTFARGHHEDYPNRKGGYWWIELYLFSSVSSTSPSRTYYSGIFFLEIKK